MAISDPIKKRLYGESANRCNMPNCQQMLSPDNANIGEIAHIISSKQGGPRHTDLADYDAYDNLILLCCNHHKVIDTNVEMYSVEYLKRIKAEHIQGINIRLTDNPYPHHRNNDIKKLQVILSFIRFTTIPFFLSELPNRIHLDFTNMADIFDGATKDFPDGFSDQNLLNEYNQFVNRYFELIEVICGDTVIDKQGRAYNSYIYDGNNHSSINTNIINDDRINLYNIVQKKSNDFLESYNHFIYFIKNNYPEIDLYR